MNYSLVLDVIITYLFGRGSLRGEIRASEGGHSFFGGGVDACLRHDGMFETRRPN